MTKCQKLPEWPGEGERPETGAMQFGDDWPGVFIRGDNAIYFGMMVEAAVALFPDGPSMERAVLQSLAKTLKSCRVGEIGDRG